MNWVDIIILVVVGLSANFGFFRGFVREAAGLLTWVLAFYLAFTGASSIGRIFSAWIASDAIRLVAGFVLIFVGILILGFIANLFLGGLVKKTGLEGIDRLLGSLFGALRGVAILVVIVLLAHATNIPQANWWHQSVLMDQLEPAAMKVRTVLPNSFSDAVTKIQNSSTPSQPTQDQDNDFNDVLDLDDDDLSGANIIPIEPYDK